MDNEIKRQGAPILPILGDIFETQKPIMTGNRIDGIRKKCFPFFPTIRPMVFFNTILVDLMGMVIVSRSRKFVWTCGLLEQIWTATKQIEATQSGGLPNDTDNYQAGKIFIGFAFEVMLDWLHKKFEIG